MISIKFVVFLFVILVLISGCIQNEGPLKTIKISDQKAQGLNYIIKYNINAERVLGNKTITKTYKELFSKSGNNEKFQTLVDNILVQEAIKNNFGRFVCTYFAPDDILCLQVTQTKEKISLENSLNALSETGIVKFTTSEKTIEVSTNTRKCDNIKYSIDKSKLTLENTKTLEKPFGLDGFYDDKDFNTDFLKDLKGSFCFDKETGILLESTSFLSLNVYKQNIMNFNENVIKKAEKIEFSPIFSSSYFNVPKGAELV